jgi:hypothetical protein
MTMHEAQRNIQVRFLAQLAATVSLVGCGALGIGEVPPPPATPEEIAKEVRYLEETFFEDDCIHRVLRAAPDVPDPQSLDVKSIYSIEFPASPMVSDGFSHVLKVSGAHRMAYLITSGGFAGLYTVKGPIPLAHCLQDVFTRS